MKDIKMMALAEKTKEIYERNRPRFDLERHKILLEKDWLKRFQDLLPSDAKILDVGCGAGKPIAQYLLKGDLISPELTFLRAC